ncbi:MAG: C40 family peptidase [Candidatus Latescibacterota bacterium]|nr:MAG: C40 family peptidase [Candidatus Latescibacterota bacterium]
MVKANLRFAPAIRGNTRGLAALIVILLLASCTSAPRYRSGPAGSSTDFGPRDADRKEIVQYAKSFIGTPYRYGGEGRGGVDCSGLVIAVYREFDIRLPRSSRDQSRSGQQVSRSDIRPADLVFFKTSGRQSVSHVGIYIGGGKFVHASTSAQKVRVDALNDDYFRRRYQGARRVVSG